MQTNESSYSNLSDYDNSSEEVFFDMKTSESNDSSTVYDQMTEDEMPIPENCEDDSLSEKESLPTPKIKKENPVTNNPNKEKKSSKQNNSTAKEDNIKITDVKIRREASYDIAELTISKPVKIMRKNQGGQLLKLRIIPPVKFTDKKNKYGQTITLVDYQIKKVIPEDEFNFIGYEVK